VKEGIVFEAEIGWRLASVREYKKAFKVQTLGFHVVTRTLSHCHSTRNIAYEVHH